MYTRFLPAIWLLAAPLGVQRGAVDAVTIVPSDNPAAVTFRITGTNPCSVVSLDPGDGTGPVRHVIRQLPASISHTYQRAGAFQVRARGMSNCDGIATTSAKVAGPRGRGSAGAMRFPAMDRNGDQIISRSEWRGSDQSFRVHDWNNDGILSGDEVRTAASRAPDEDMDWTLDDGEFIDWTEQRFRELDHSRDGRLTRNEWHYPVDSFVRADRNRDGALTLSEFVGNDFDDDRGDRFEYLDVNRNGRVERSEWHASADAFEWLDRNNDNVLSRAEVTGNSADPSDLFSSLDVNRDQRISVDEWHWSRRSFTERDSNRDGVLNRSEFGSIGNPSVPATSTTVSVRAAAAWNDTGLVVRAGDRLSFNASGTVRLSGDPSDLADPQGARSGRFAGSSPLPKELGGALIGRVGDSTAFYIGAGSTSIQAPATGRLYLGVNDDHNPDNSGEYRVTVAVGR